MLLSARSLNRATAEVCRKSGDMRTSGTGVKAPHHLSIVTTIPYLFSISTIPQAQRISIVTTNSVTMPVSLFRFKAPASIPTERLHLPQLHQFPLPCQLPSSPHYLQLTHNPSRPTTQSSTTKTPRHYVSLATSPSSPYEHEPAAQPTPCRSSPLCRPRNHRSQTRNLTMRSMRC